MFHSVYCSIVIGVSSKCPLSINHDAAWGNVA